MRRLKLLVVLVCLSWVCSAYSNESDRFFNRYNFHFITERFGLPYSVVTDIIQDSDGYIWAATYNGLARYDGYQFLNYNSQTHPIRLKNGFVHHLCEDKFKRLWVATEGGLDLIDLNTYASVRLPFPSDTILYRLQNSFIHTIYKDKKDDLWIACNNDLWHLRLDANGQVCEYHVLRSKATSPIHAVVDMGDFVCAGIDNEICIIEKAGNHILKAVPLSDELVPFSEDWRISCLLMDGDFLWIGSNRGLFKYNHFTKSLKRYRYSTHRPGMLSQAYITDIKLTELGYLIVSTLNGLNVYHRDTDTFSFIRQGNTQNGSGINCNGINCIFTSGETIWLGTETGGINLLSPKRLQTEMWACPLLGKEGEHAAANAITEDASGNLWIGLVERGLVEWDPVTNSYKRYLFSPGDMTSISNNTINGLFTTADNHLWIYTWGVGINDLDLNKPDERKFKRYTREEFSTLKGDFISSACEDTINRGIWFGSTRGVLFYDRETNSFSRVLLDRVTNEFESIHALLIDKKKRLWVGSSQGVFIIDLFSFAKSRKRFDYTYLRYKLDDPESGKIEKINSILEDHEGNIWLGGNGSGLYKLSDDKNGRFSFKNYTTQHGLPNNTVLGMTEDGQGNLWIVTYEGLTKVNPYSMTFISYTQSDGLPTAQFYWNGIYYSSRNDLLYLATTSGLLIIHSENELLPSGIPEVRLSSLTVAGNVVYPLDGNYLEEPVTKASKITLHESESRFSIGLTTCNYGNNRRIRFAYRLKGYEKEWNETLPGDCMVRYTALPAGNYILQVRATDEYGHWSEYVREVQVRIIPYFYKTVWFYLSILILAVLGAWWFYRRKTRRFREQRIELEQKVEERTQKLAVQNRQLEEMAQHVKDVTEEKIAFFTNITHEFRTPVTLIHGPIEHALKEVTDEHVKADLQIAERNSSYLLSLVNELMDFRKLDMDKVTLDRKPCQFVALLSELLLPFKVFAKERQIEIRFFSRVSTPWVLLDAAYMRKALVNLISNAIKFTPDRGRIDVFVASVRGKDGTPMLYIDVCDTGHGIVEEDMEKIFDRFFQSKKSVKYPVYGQSGTGIGLFLCRKIVELHEGTIHARNNHSKGASFRILMPFVPSEELELVDDKKVLEEAKILDGENLTGGQKKATILIVEDNKDMRSYIRTLLEREYCLLEAENGQEALETIQHHNVDLIVSDLMMPVMDGLELSRRIKENLATSHIPFLMLTAIRSEAQEKESYKIGVDEYLCKPFDADMLLLRIRNILNLRQKYKKMFSASSNVDDLPMKEESRDQVFIARALELMQKNYGDSEYVLDNFVRDMGYSKTMVNKKMQVLTGQPIGQFMKGYRLNIAQKMIQESTGDFNVSEIAYAVGFNDPKYFTKCFKEFFGYLPSSLLKK